MRIAKGNSTINTIEEWFLHAPPAEREKHWKVGRSALEMAREWLTDEAESRLTTLLTPVFGRLTFSSAEPERKVKFDQYSGPRNCDLAIQAKCERGHLTIHIEGKADEPFDRLIGPYVKKMTLIPASRLPHRIELLSQKLFGQPVDERVNRLWYQLVQGCGAALTDAAANNSIACVFIVHEFRSAELNSKKLARNGIAWHDFLAMFRELTDVDLKAEEILLGPIVPPWPESRKIPIYFAKIKTILR